jgi:phenylpyruvate tautomerase PptA (4-oxalocrotonate tautomerase family)
MIARVCLITHWPPAQVLNLTPEQTAVIIEEYVAMNDTGERAQEMPLGDLKVARHTGSAEESELAQRVKAEFAAKLGKHHA